MFSSRSIRLASVFAGLVMAFSMVAVDQAEARRGGSFGSRGTRTFQSAPATNTAPRQTAPVERSMTPNTVQQSTPGRPNAQAAQQRPGFMNGLGGSLMRGLMFGGLIGLLMGYGFGGFAGMFGLLLQALLIGGAIFLLLRFMRSRSPAVAGGPQGMNRSSYVPYEPRAAGAGGMGIPGTGVKPGTSARKRNPDELGVSGEDLDTFERMLTQVQEAFGREDYGALRPLTTPEMMSYLSEELGENASNGLRNEVSGLKLLQGDVSESWREGNRDYATVAMRYSSVDATRDRDTGRVVNGDADRPTESTELWTFTREDRGPWLLSAIQEAK